MANSSKPVCHAASRPAFRASSNDAFCILVPLLSRPCLISAGWPGPADAPRRVSTSVLPVQEHLDVLADSRISRGSVEAPEDRAARRRPVPEVVRHFLVGHLQASFQRTGLIEFWYFGRSRSSLCRSCSRSSSLGGWTWTTGRSLLPEVICRSAPWATPIRNRAP